MVDERDTEISLSASLLKKKNEIIKRAPSLAGTTLLHAASGIIDYLSLSISNESVDVKAEKLPLIFEQIISQVFTVKALKISELLAELEILRVSTFTYLRSAKLIRRSDDSLSESFAALTIEIVKNFEIREIRTKIRSEERLKVAVETAKIGIWEMDCRDGSVWRTEMHDFLFGFTEFQPQWNFEIFLTFVHPDDRERVIRATTQALEQKTGGKLQCRIIWNDKSVHWLEETWVIEKNADGIAERFIGTLIDITQAKLDFEERMNYAALAHMDLNELKAEREIRERFVSTLTHDLRNPLTAAKLSAELLLKGIEKSAVRENSALRIVECLERADRMIQDLLDANKLRAGHGLPIQVSSCNLENLLASVVDELTVIHGERFVLNCVKNLDGYWSSEDIRRVIGNLADNAIKYGDTKKPVTIKAGRAGDEVMISVHNFGEELGAEDMGRIFKQYHRSPAAEKSGKKGWGIGLTLVRGIIEAHGGQLSVESTKELGTTFLFRMPLDCRKTVPTT